jgi:LPS export ABC transporter protein LptC
MKKNYYIIADSLSKGKIFWVTSFIVTIKLLLRSHKADHLSTLRSTLLSPFYFLLFTFYFVSCENDPVEIDRWTKKTELIEEAKTVESYLSQSGEMRAKLTAPLMYRYQRDTVYTEFPNTLHVDFYDDSVRVESWLTAKYGIYYDNLNKVFLRDSVTVINMEGDTLRCPELWWDQNSQKFYTDKPARLDGKDKHLTGTQGLEATQDLKVIQFKYPIGPFDIKEGSMP